MTTLSLPNDTDLNPHRTKVFKEHLPSKQLGKHHLLVHTVATLIIFGTIVTMALIMSNHFKSFPQDFIWAFSQPKTYIALGTTALTLLGGGMIIRSIVKDPRNGKFSGHDHWLPTYINSQGDVLTPEGIQTLISLIQGKEHQDQIKLIQTFIKELKIKNFLEEKNISEDKITYCVQQQISKEVLGLSNSNLSLLIADLERAGYSSENLKSKQEELLTSNAFQDENMGNLDTSTADTGQCAFYTHKGPVDNELVATAVIATAPIHAGLTIINNTLRALFVPIKLAYTGQVRQIPTELKADGWRLITAPFFAGAAILAGLYMWIDPENGEKLVAAVENKWNEGVPLHQSAWAATICNGCYSCCCFNPLPIRKVAIDAFRKWTRGGGFYVAGCAQKHAIATLNDSNEITKVSGFPHFFIPGNEKEQTYTPYFRE